MSHTLTIKVRETTYYVAHNGGWDGEVFIRNDKNEEETVVQGEVLVEIARRAATDLVREKVVGFLDSLDELPTLV